MNPVPGPACASRTGRGCFHGASVRRTLCPAAPTGGGFHCSLRSQHGPTPPPRHRVISSGVENAWCDTRWGKMHGWGSVAPGPPEAKRPPAAPSGRPVNGPESTRRHPAMCGLATRRAVLSPVHRACVEVAGRTWPGCTVTPVRDFSLRAIVRCRHATLIQGGCSFVLPVRTVAAPSRCDAAIRRRHVAGDPARES